MLIEAEGSNKMWVEKCPLCLVIRRSLTNTSRAFLLEGRDGNYRVEENLGEKLEKA